MGALRKLRAYAAIFRNRRRDRPFDLVRLLRRRPALLLGLNAFEFAQLASGRVDVRLKAMAQTKTAALVNCEFCLDIGSAVSIQLGMSEAQLRDLSRYRISPVFDAVERLVLDLTVAMAHTPVDIPAELNEALRRQFDETQLVELVSAIAWEHYRARFNRALGIRPAGFLGDGAVCAVAEPAAVESGAPIVSA